MSRLLSFVAALVFCAAPLSAQCVGKNLIDALPTAERATLEADVAAQPYPRGNFWRATRGTEVLHLIGTYHIDDPRHAQTMTRVKPLLDDATVLLVEAGPKEEAALKQAMARDPSLILSPGTTLPELLSEADWQLLATALRTRGIPPFMAAKFRPWYVTVLLAIPACAMDLARQENGLDKQLIDAAGVLQLPVQALEPFDTVFKLFNGLGEKEQLDMIRTTLPLEAQGADYSVTLADGYFSGDSRRVWEFMRIGARDFPGYTQESADAEYAALEEALLSTRNRAWIPVIEATLQKGPVVAAFGALHLAGEDGVLALLEHRGFTIQPLKQGQ